MNRHYGVALICVLWCGDLEAQSGRRALTGRVTAGGQPIAGVAIVPEVPGRNGFLTDSLGRFAIEGLSLGSQRFQVRHVAFQPVDFEVTFAGDTVLHLEVSLVPRTHRLDSIEVRVTGDELGPYARKLLAVGFEERRLQGEASATDATFLSPADIQHRKPVRLSHLLEGQRSIRISYSEGGIVATPLGRDGRCTMSLWVDGQQVSAFPAAAARGGISFQSGPTSAGASSLPGLDMIAASDVAAVEIYPSPTGTPPQFQNLTGNCGAIVVWTKQ